LSNFFETPIEFLKGVGPQRATLLQKELKIFSFGDLIQHFPFRYEDRTKFYSIREVSDEMPYVQVKGRFTDFEIVGVRNKKRLIGYFSDGTNEMEMIWFQRIDWVMQKIKPNIEYVAFGKPTRYGNKINIAHPEIEPITESNLKGNSFQPVYPITEKLRARYIDSKQIAKLEFELFRQAENHIRETLPDFLLKQQNLLSKK
jgi:ATP-dependent DNA helicase RecG